MFTLHENKPLNAYQKGLYVYDSEQLFSWDTDARGEPYHDVVHSRLFSDRQAAHLAHSKTVTTLGVLEVLTFNTSHFVPPEFFLKLLRLYTGYDNDTDIEIDCYYVYNNDMAKFSWRGTVKQWKKTLKANPPPKASRYIPGYLSGDNYYPPLFLVAARGWFADMQVKKSALGRGGREDVWEEGFSAYNPKQRKGRK